MSEKERVSGRERREERRRWRERPRRILRVATVLGIAVAIGSGVGALIGVLVLPSVLDGGDQNNAPAALASPTPGGEQPGPPPVEGELRLTESGLGIIDIVEGPGATPEPGDLLTVDYTGWLSDGTKFGSTLEDGEPYEFVLGEQAVIDGWEEGLATMKVGGERRLVIPPELGYGEEGAVPLVPPNSKLTFNIKLLKIAKPVEATPTETPPVQTPSG